MSKYLDLARDGLVPKMDCPLDQGLLFANLDENDSLFLYCISCSYKTYIGLSVYDKIKKEVEKNV